MFLIFPCALESDEQYKNLSANAKILYMHLLRLNDMSEKNGWYDEEKKIYIYCSRKSMSKFLKCSVPTACRVFKQLRDAGLVRVGKRENGSSPRLYVLKLIKNSSPSKSDGEPDEWELEILQSMTGE